MPAPTRAELALPMRRGLNSNHRRPQVRHLTKKLDWTFTIPALQFPIRRTHPAQRLNAALHTLSHPRTLAIPQLQQGLFPHRADSNLPNTESLLLRDHTNPYLSVSVNGKSIHSPAAEINRVGLRQVGRTRQIALRQPAILAHAFRSIHVDRHHFFRRQPHRQRTLRTVDARVDLPIHLELDAQFFFRELPHRQHFMLVDAGGDSFQFERKPSLAQQFDPAQATVIGAWNRRQRLVGLPRPAVQRDLDRERRPLGQIVRNRFREKRAVGEQRNQKALLLGVGVDF